MGARCSPGGSEGFRWHRFDLPARDDSGEATHHDHTPTSTSKPSTAKPRSWATPWGQTLLVVSVAPRCGLTPHCTWARRAVPPLLGAWLRRARLPRNDFGAQGGTESEIKEICQSKYDVTFPLFSKLHVKGPEQAALYRYLTTQSTVPDGPGDIQWNFAKFLVDPKGQVIARFSPKVEPLAPELVSKLEAALPA